MSDVPQGEGWWLASDGRWYPPAGSSVGATRPGGITLNSTTVVPGLVLSILGVMIGMSGLAPWFSFVGIEISGFRGDFGDTDGWIFGIPVGWFLLLAGMVVLLAGLLLVLAPDLRLRRLATATALVVPVLTAIVIVLERYKIHHSFDDAMRTGPNDQFSFSFGDAFGLSDTIGLWLALAACIVVVAAALWAAVLVFRSDA